MYICSVFYLEVEKNSARLRMRIIGYLAISGMIAVSSSIAAESHDRSPPPPPPLSVDAMRAGSIHVPLGGVYIVDKEGNVYFCDGAECTDTGIDVRR